MRWAAFALVLVFGLAPLRSGAKQMLGVLHHGASVVEFVLAGNTILIEQQEAPGSRDDVTVMQKDLGCTSVGTNHTMTMLARGLKVRRQELAKNDAFVLSTQKTGGRTWVFNPDEDAAAFALAAKLNRLAHCK